MQHMKEIGSIHVFEDEELLSHIAKLSAAVFVSGVALSVALAIEGYFHSIFDPFTYVLIAVGSVLAVMLHEGIHAVFFKVFAPKGSKVAFGANLQTFMVYAKSEGVVYTRLQYMIIAMAPTVIITVLLAIFAACTSRLGASYYTALVHLTGCVGDWCYFEQIWGDKRITHVEDTDFGVRFFTDAA